VDAAHISGRPLGGILVDQGLLTGEELETALSRQEASGRRLGETIVDCGFVSGPDLADALAAQCGIELTTESGFGTGLRTLIQRRHDSGRRRERPLPVEPPPAVDSAPAAEEGAEELDVAAVQTHFLSQLEEQWARLAAAEELVTQLEQALADARRGQERARAQAVRLARRARGRSAGERRSGARRELDRLRHELEELRRFVLRRGQAGTEDA
jgi:hypothetical protein